MSNYACIVVRSISSICPLNSQYSTVYLVKKTRVFCTISIKKDLDFPDSHY